jgi:IS605 OrfB family transposase
VRGFSWRRDRLESKLAKLEVKEPVISICLGSRRLFHAQYNLEVNGYRSHEDWLVDWRASRTDHFTVIGSKDETAGCQNCVLTAQDEGTYSLRLTMPPALVTEHGKHLVLTGLRFSYGSEYLDKATWSNAERKVQAKLLGKGTLASPVSKALAGYGQAISYRFRRDAKGWRVIATTQRAVASEIVTSRKHGAIGCDFNNHHVAVTEIDRKGNKVTTYDLPFRDAEATSMQSRTQLQTAAKRIAEQAYALGKPVAIEDLDFKQKKRKLIKGSDRKMNKVVSTLAYRCFRTAIERNCALLGVECIAVQPAYTSMLGAVLYHNQTEYSTHSAAALCIARRALGMRERAPEVVHFKATLSKQTYAFSIPEDLLKDIRKLQNWCSYAPVLSALRDWLAHCRHAVEEDVPICGTDCDTVGLSLLSP